MISRLKFLVLSFSFTLYALSFALLPGCENKHLYKNSQLLMGTFVEVSSQDKLTAEIVFREIKRIENLFSKYKEDSEISKLNKIGELKEASRDTLYLLKKAKEFWILTDGAFDITIAPLMDLWGFTEKKIHLPEQEKIEETLNLVGMDKIVFNDLDNMVKFSIPGMKVDLGAIAKGYAVDCAAEKLKRAGIKSCLINAGGDIYCLGDNSGKAWKIAIQNPRGKKFLGYLELKNKAVATSGDYEQFFIKDKKRYSHIFNPKTGYPADSGVTSVTVIAPDCLTADALATAAFVLGKENVEELAKKFPDTQVRITSEEK